MSFEDYIRTRIDARAEVSVRLGRVDDDSHVSIMTWDDKVTGTFFWKVEGGKIELMHFVGDDDE